jgi:hypothetical protein
VNVAPVSVKAAGSDGAGRELLILRPATANERHYTPQEIAKLWAVSQKSVIRVFEKEPGVLVLQNSLGRHSRRHRTMRIPFSVLERVHRSREVA